MRRPASAVAFAAVAAAAAALTGCSSDDYELSSTDVAATGATEVRAGTVEVVLPAGAATGGRLAVQEGPEPANVPEGVVPLGDSAMVSLFEGTLQGPMEVSFDAPAELTPDQVPIVMARSGTGDWQWLPTTWDDPAQVTAELGEPGQVFLSRFDPAPWLEDAGKEFTAKANKASRAKAPTCGDESAAVDRGLQVSGEPTELVGWCAGVDTIESTPSVAGADLDYATDGVQATVLRVTNTSRMYREVGYPDGWPAVDGSGRRGLPGQELRERLGLAGSTRDGLATRLLAPGDTLTLMLPADATGVAGTVTADLSAAAWTLSSIDFASSTYARLVAGVDDALRDAVWKARAELLATLADPRAEPVDPTGEEAGAADLEALRECLAPVAEVVLMNADVARELLGRAAECTPAMLRPALPEQYGVSPAGMADAVAANVLAGLPSALADAPEPWAQVSDAATDPRAGLQVWVGPPPAEEHDYTGAPHVFRPGDEVDVPEWSTEFRGYVEERLALLAGDGTADCTDGGFSVSRYRTDGFALAGQVSCAGEEHRLVLGRLVDGWQELDSIQQDPFFGCAVMGSYSVPVFIAGETCLDGDQTQEYTG